MPFFLLNRTSSIIMLTRSCTAASRRFLVLLLKLFNSKASHCLRSPEAQTSPSSFEYTTAPSSPATATAAAAAAVSFAQPHLHSLIFASHALMAEEEERRGRERERRRSEREFEDVGKRCRHESEERRMKFTRSVWAPRGDARDEDRGAPECQVSGKRKDSSKSAAWPT